jgi:hypothetical protein
MLRLLSLLDTKKSKHGPFHELPASRTSFMRKVVKRTLRHYAARFVNRTMSDLSLAKLAVTAKAEDYAAEVRESLLPLR